MLFQANVIVFTAAWYTSYQGHFRHADVDSSYLKYIFAYTCFVLITNHILKVLFNISYTATVYVII